ncbi:MAG: caspase family protein [Acidobacteriota bacterium]
MLQTGLTSPAANIIFSPDGRLLASMGIDGSAIKLWEVSTGRQLRSFNLGPRNLLSNANTLAFNFTPDGRLLACLSSQKIRLWEVETGRELPGVSLPTNEDFVWSGFSANGQILATKTLGNNTTTSNSNAIKLWDVATGRQLSTVAFDFGQGLRVDDVSLALSADGKWLASSSSTNKVTSKGFVTKTEVILWDVTTGRKIKSFDVPDTQTSQGIGSYPRRSVAFSPDGQWLAMSIRDKSVSNTIPPGLNMSGKPQNEKKGSNSASLTGPVVYEPGKQKGSQENKINVWEVASGRELKTLTISDAAANKVIDGSDLPSEGTFAINYDRRLLASATNDRAIKVVDPFNGNELHTLVGHQGLIVRVAFSSDGRLLASSSADNTITLWDAVTGREVRTLTAMALPVGNIAFTNNGRSLVSGGFQAVNIWETTTGGVRRSVALPDEDSARTIGFMGQVQSSSGLLSPDGRFLASGSTTSPTVRIWDAATGNALHSLTLPAGKLLGEGAFSPDGRVLALVEKNDKNASQAVAAPSPVDQDSMQRIQDVMKDPKKMREIQQRMADLTKDPKYKELQKKMEEASQKGEMGKIAELSEEMMKQMASIYSTTVPSIIPIKLGGSVKLWDVTTGRELRSLQIDIPPNDYSSIAVIFSPDGRLLATGSSAYPMKLWNVDTGQEVRAFKSDRSIRVDRIAFSPDGRRLASAHWETTEKYSDKKFSSDQFSYSVKIWDAGTGGLLHSLTGHSNSIAALAFSRDGNYVVSGGHDNTIKLWDVATGRELRTLYGHSSAIAALDFSPDGRLLVSGSQDGSARVWNIQTGELLGTVVSLNKGADWLVITPDGLFDGSPAAWDQILWRFSQNTFDVSPVEIFFHEFYYPGLLADVLAGRKVKASVDITEKDRRQPKLSITLADGQPAGVAVSTRNVKVKINVTESPAGAQDLRLFRNGSLVKVWRGDVLKGQGVAALETTLPIVAGENRLAAYAFNRDNVKSSDARLTIEGASNLKREGTAYILAIGVNQYANPEYNLKYAVADAQVFAEEVKRQQLKLGRFARIQTFTLLDRDATKANVLLALKQFSGSANDVLPAGTPAVLEKIKPAEPEDAVIVFYAGHGTAQRQRFYLIPHDLGYQGARTSLDESSLNSILAHSISDLEVEEALEKVDAGQILMVIDACNSGQALEAEEKRRGPMNSKGLAQLAYEKGMYILTAAQSYQAAMEAEQLGHGYLTYALVEEGLKSTAADSLPKDGQVVLREWLDYATDRVPKMQEAKMREGRELKHKVAFVEGEEKEEDVDKRSVQRPRVFYRREPETQPLIVAKP